jgi:hypothetical protein
MYHGSVTNGLRKEHVLRPPFLDKILHPFFFLWLSHSLLLLKSLPINIINCIKFYVNCSNTLKCIVFHVIWMLFTYANDAQIIWHAELSSSHHAMRYCYHSVSIARSHLCCSTLTHYTDSVPIDLKCCVLGVVWDSSVESCCNGVQHHFLRVRWFWMNRKMIGEVIYIRVSDRK